MLKKILPCLLLSQSLFAGTFCVAHRANGFGEIENSFAAIKAANTNRVDGIEIDIQHTLDGETIVYHDKELNRLVFGDECKKGLKISKYKKEDIEKCKLDNGESIPTLKSVLEEVSLGRSILFIELKDGIITEKDYLDIKEVFRGKANQVIFISFDSKVLKKVKEYGKKDNFFSQTKVLRLRGNGNRINLRAYDGIDTSRIDQVNVVKYQQSGKIVGVYTKNTKEQIKREFKKGVHFITTDNYNLCNSLVSE